MGGARTRSSLAPISKCKSARCRRVARHFCLYSPQAARLARRPKLRLPTIRILTSPATSRDLSARASCGTSLFRSRRAASNHDQCVPCGCALRIRFGTDHSTDDRRDGLHPLLVHRACGSWFFGRGVLGIPADKRRTLGSQTPRYPELSDEVTAPSGLYYA